MMVVEYEAQFRALDRHVTFILTTVYERVCCFVWGLRIPHHLSK